MEWCWEEKTIAHKESCHLLVYGQGNQKWHGKRQRAGNAVSLIRVNENQPREVDENLAELVDSTAVWQAREEVSQ